MLYSKIPLFSQEEGDFDLADQVRNQGHEASALDRIGQLALMPGADAGALARNDFAKG